MKTVDHGLVASGDSSRPQPPNRPDRRLEAVSQRTHRVVRCLTFEVVDGIFERVVSVYWKGLAVPPARPAGRRTRLSGRRAMRQRESASARSAPATGANRGLIATGAASARRDRDAGIIVSAARREQLGGLGQSRVGPASVAMPIRTGSQAAIRLCACRSISRAGADFTAAASHLPHLLKCAGSSQALAHHRFETRDGFVVRLFLACASRACCAIRIVRREAVLRRSVNARVVALAFATSRRASRESTGRSVSAASASRANVIARVRSEACERRLHVREYGLVRRSGITASRRGASRCRRYSPTATVNVRTMSARPHRRTGSRCRRSSRLAEHRCRSMLRARSYRRRRRPCPEPTRAPRRRRESRSRAGTDQRQVHEQARVAHA